jgi:hypothetical protein
MESNKVPSAGSAGICQDFHFASIGDCGADTGSACQDFWKHILSDKAKTFTNSIYSSISFLQWHDRTHFLEATETAGKYSVMVPSTLRSVETHLTYWLHLRTSPISKGNLRISHIYYSRHHEYSYTHAHLHHEDWN